jgi:hypothetical protein
MPLELPNLDDRRYADLVNEALALIPAHAPEWTNHNPSDPGITLVELFAYLTEMLIYRLNRVTEANQRAFLQLLNGNDPNWTYDEKKPLNHNIQDVVLKLRHEERAVTVKDFERLALAAINDNNARVYCLPSWDLDAEPKQRKEGHISMVVVLAHEFSNQVKEGEQADKLNKLLEKVKGDLLPRCLITTRLHVTGAKYIGLRVQIRLRINPDTLDTVVLNNALDALNHYFDPLIGGGQGTGWPLGQNVYVSDLYALLDTLPGVDYVEKYLDANNKPLDEIVPSNLARRLPESPDKQLVGIRLEPYELIQFDASANDIQIVRDTNNNRKR